VRAAANGLIVPRGAVLPDEGGSFTLFTVAGDHAAKHTVKLGLENDREAQVIADDLKPGDAVVVSGNYALTDGMQVEVEPAESSPPTSPSASPTTSPSGAAQ
jgi:multidrug efflux pump subunit AcrA (membrane-fusion protein)